MPAFPTAAIILPQFGSSPNKAVLTKEEVATVCAIWWASWESHGSNKLLATFERCQSLESPHTGHK